MNLAIQYIITVIVLIGCIFLTVKYFKDTMTGKDKICSGCVLKDSCKKKDQANDKECSRKRVCH